MSVDRNPFEHELDRVALDPIAPRAEWVSGLGATGREAARRREEQGTWSAGLASAGRWFLPLAAATALACWIASALSPPARTHGSPLIADGSEREALIGAAMEARR